MTGVPLRFCATVGCPERVRRGHCHRHSSGPRQPWSSSRPPARIRGTKLQAMRERLFQEHPHCQECLKHGRRTVATIRDHVIPLAEGGADDETNEAAVCIDCHQIKTQAESARGIQRSRGLW